MELNKRMPGRFILLKGRRVFSFTVYYSGWPLIKRYGISAYDLKQARKSLKKVLLKGVMAIEYKSVR